MFNYDIHSISRYVCNLMNNSCLSGYVPYEMLGRESYFHGLTLYTVSFLRQSSKINGKRHTLK